MPLFFFDYHDGDRVLRDIDGIELETLQEARVEASAALGDLARDMCRGSLSRTLAINVLGSERLPLFRLALTLDVEIGAEARDA
jgi:hypothetical protein